MTKRLNSKHKVDRRLKVNLWGRPKSPFNKRGYKLTHHFVNQPFLAKLANTLDKMRVSFLDSSIL